MKNIKLQSREWGNIETSFNYFKKFGFPKAYKVLDVGCSYGSLINHMYQSGYKNVYGVDLKDSKVSVGKKEYSKISKRLLSYEGEVLPYEDDSFDVLMMFDVIEHIPNVEKFLSGEVARVLKKGGYFIFQTPNKYINVPWEVLSKKSLTRWKDFHPSVQTKRSLKKILLNCGFKDVVIQKNEIVTEHNIKKVREKLGLLGVIILKNSNKLPLFLYPNFWGSCKK